MTPELGESGELPPEAQITLVIEAVMLRAELAEAHEERQANWERLAAMWQPTMDDIDNANDLQSLAINTYAIARIQNADDLEILADALDLVDGAIEMLEDPNCGLTRVLTLCLEQIGDRFAETRDFPELKEPLDVLREVVGIQAKR